MKNQETLHPELSPAKRAQIEYARKLAIAAAHQQALQRMNSYNENPNHCSQCGTAILILPEKMNRTGFQQTKKKKFCNQSCGAKYNMARTEVPRNKPKNRICTSCRAPFIKSEKNSSRNRCSACVYECLSTLALKTKAESSLNSIRGHARATMLKTKPPICEVCGYSFHVDCCHIKPIGSFPHSTGWRNQCSLQLSCSLQKPPRRTR